MHISESFSLCVRFPKDSQLPPNVREQKAPITEQQGEVIHLPSCASSVRALSARTLTGKRDF